MRAITVAVLVCSALMARAQLSVRVEDAATREPAAFAQVSWQPLGPFPSHVLVTGADGGVLIPVNEEQARQGIVVGVALLGYERITDTLRALAPVRYRLLPRAFNLDEAVVTGQYRAAPAEKAVHKVRVIDEERLRKLAANDLSDALRNELNIRLSQDNILGTNMGMQGLGGENVKILVDGVPVIGRQDGNIDLAQIGLNGIARIEVVEGPLSVSYGTNALAGTVNLITKKGASTAPSAGLTAYAEHIGRLNLWANASKRWGKHALNLNLGRDYFNGWDPREKGLPELGRTLADTARFKQWKPREKYSARINYRWSSVRWQLGWKGEFNDDRITNRGRPQAPYNVTAFDETYLTRRFDNGLFADRHWGNGRKFTLIAAHERYRRTRNTWRRDLTDLSEQLVATPGMQDTSRFTLTNVRAVYASAGDSSRLRYEVGTDLNYETGAGERIGSRSTAGGGAQAIGDYAVYASAEYRPANAITLRPAVRYAYNTVYGAPLTPSFNLRWRLDSALTLRASWARGFRAPSLKELYLFFVDVNHNIQGNTDLRAERSNTFSASIVWRKPAKGGAWRADLDGFYNDIDDLITLAQVDGALYSYVNIGRYRTTGGNAGAGWEGEKWSFMLGGNATGRNDDLAQQQSQRWLWSYEGRANVSRSWQRTGLTAQVFFKHQGRLQSYAYQSDGTVGRSAIAAFQVADASVTKRFWARRAGVTAGCKNLFDVRNVATILAGGGMHAGGGTSTPMMTGRIFFLRLDLEFNGKEK